MNQFIWESIVFAKTDRQLEEAAKMLNANYGYIPYKQYQAMAQALNKRLSK